MPTFNIPVVYQTANQAEIVAALKWNYGLLPGATNTEALDKLKATTHQNLIDITQRYREHVAVEAAKASLPPRVVIT